MPAAARALLSGALLALASRLAAQTPTLPDVISAVGLLCDRGVTHVLVAKEPGGLLQGMAAIKGASREDGTRPMSYLVGVDTPVQSKAGAEAAVSRHIESMLPPGWPPADTQYQALYRRMLAEPVNVRFTNRIIEGAMAAPRLPLVVVDDMAKLEGIGVPDPRGDSWKRKARFPWMKQPARLDASFDMDDIGLFQALQQQRRVAILRPLRTWQQPAWENAGAVDKPATVTYYNDLGYAVCDTGAPEQDMASTLIFPAEHLDAMKALLPPSRATYWCNGRCMEAATAITIRPASQRARNEL